MRVILGIDTSNYTTSAALIDADSGALVASAGKLLPVKEGQRGIRQSDAVFHHTAALAEILREVYSGLQVQTVAVAVSEKPAEQEGSYMPCFLAGVNAAAASASACGVPLYKTSHQIGHILACLYGCESLAFLRQPFICFHVSGGTTDALLVKPEQERLCVERVAKSSDLKAGQAVDRIGVKMGLHFPAGKALEALALQSDKHYTQCAKLNGADCSLSGLENLALKMLQSGEKEADCAKFVFDYLANTLEKMSLVLLEKYTDLPLFFAGGVMSNSIIKERLHKSLGAHFCPPRFSADNAVGIAYYGYLQWNNSKN
ncbi:MAG: peptidase M22 [Clostridia bacterium]|nr:peptidase M22 [Clostridia bacterium]